MRKTLDNCKDITRLCSRICGLHCRTCSNELAGACHNYGLLKLLRPQLIHPRALTASSIQSHLFFVINSRDRRVCWRNWCKLYNTVTSRYLIFFYLRTGCHWTEKIFKWCFTIRSARMTQTFKRHRTSLFVTRSDRDSAQSVQQPRR